MRTFTDCPCGALRRLDHEVVGPGGKSLTNPLTTLICPVNLHLRALEINRAEIIFDRRAFRILKTHGEPRASAESHSTPWDGVCVPFLVGECRCVVVFAVQQHLPHLRKNIRDVGRLGGPPMRHIQHFVSERNLFGIGIACQLNGHASSAGEKNVVAGRQTAKAPPRHDLAPDPFRQRHRRDCHVGKLRRLGQELVRPRAAKKVGGTIFVWRRFRLSRRRLGIVCACREHRQQIKRTYQASSGRACFNKVSAFHNYLSQTLA